MRFAIDVAPLGELADPLVIVKLARAAEASGWDGISIWDSFGISMGTSAADPFVALAAVATATERLELITSVLALTRRRPQLVVQAVASLDRLSGGRLVVGVGAGGDPGDFRSFGEDWEAPSRLARFDEAVEIVDALLRGDVVEHEGPAFAIHGVAVGPRPVRQPRPPIWLGGMRPGAIRRAARWDGWIAIAMSDDGSAMTLTPDALAGMVREIRGSRAGLGKSDAPFDVALFAVSDRGDPGMVGSFADAGSRGGWRASARCAGRSSGSWRSSRPDRPPDPQRGNAQALRRGCHAILMPRTGRCVRSWRTRARIRTWRSRS